MKAFQLALCRVVVGELTSDDLPQIAVEALLLGAESPSLAALAGAARCEGPAERRDLLRQALAELGMALPTTREAVATLRDLYAAEVVSGDRAPAAAAHALHELREALPHREVSAGDDLGLWVFTSAHYTYDDCDEEWADPSMRLRVDAEVREACAALVAAGSEPR
jgi:hypothetical protein